MKSYQLSFCFLMGLWSQNNIQVYIAILYLVENKLIYWNGCGNSKIAIGDLVCPQTFQRVAVRLIVGFLTKNGCVIMF